MRTRQIYSGPPRTFVLVFDVGEEVKAGILRLAEEQDVGAAELTGIGALSAVQLRYFDWDRKEYQTRELDEQVELVSLAGNVAESDEGKKVHVHVVVAKRDGTAHGGDLGAATARPTVEIVLTESPGHLRRRVDPETGLPLIA